MQQIGTLARFKNNRIMVVDDEEFCIAFMKAILLKAGIVRNQINLCITGLEAVTQLKKTTETGLSYKLILMDFQMPERRFQGNSTDPRQPSLYGYFICRPTYHYWYNWALRGEFHLSGEIAGMIKVVAKPIYFDSVVEILKEHKLF